MTNAELREALDEYGDHLNVVIVINQGANDRVVPNFEVTDSSESGETQVTLLVDA